MHWLMSERKHTFDEDTIMNANTSLLTNGGTAVAEQTRDTRVVAFHELPSPNELIADIPLSDEHQQLVARSRQEIADILAGRDSRLLVVVGPCSVHDPEAAVEYAKRLAQVAEAVKEHVLVVMRVYFEKPRTTVGWKGLINDPHRDSTYDIPTGLQMARKVLVDVLDLGLPTGCEFLEPISPQYIADAVSWGAIGARTTESQVHRQLASGVSMPIGFKNATDGNVEVAIDGIRAAQAGHVFFGSDDEGRASVVQTAGNPDCHVILRGGRGGTNYDSDAIGATLATLIAVGQPPHVMVDASHANSGKSHERQVEVVRELAAMIEAGQPGIAAIMMESFLIGGAQSADSANLVFGQSITDACMDWEATEASLNLLYSAVKKSAESQ